MNEHLKYFIERKTFIGKIARIARERQLKKKYDLWQKNGSDGPMPNYGKQQTVIEHIKKFSTKVFIETGTYKGKMVYAVMPYVEKIYSIELDEKLAEDAQKRFCGNSGIKIIHGQSGEVLPELMKNVESSCLFWLDAHYSGGSTAKGELETPIMQELDSIFKHHNIKQHVILIDDARCFTGEKGYPKIETLKEYILSKKQKANFELKNDIIRIF